MFEKNLPNNKDLPFFAYGIFKPGQIAFSRIEPFIKPDPILYQINHKMYIRDGIPFIRSDVSNHSATEGYLIEFEDDKADEAYDIIGEVESKELYYWKEIKVGDRLSNVLIGRSPDKSRPEPIGRVYDGRHDPLFEDAIELICDDLDDLRLSHDVKNYFRIQRNYILLWSAIERYTSLRYGNDFKVNNNEKLSNEVIFQKSLKKYLNPNKTRHIFRTDNLRKYTLDCNDPKESIDYYYTIRCNIVHRGKSVYNDQEIVLNSLKELLNIFRDMLNETFKIE